MDEKFVWWLWQTRRYSREKARRCGFDVVFPGWFSTGAGPDFRDAMIADASGSLQTGDVEIHIRESSWRDHHHDVDPNYDNVILHVTLEESPHSRTRTSAGRQVPMLALQPLLEMPLEQLQAVSREWRPAVVRCPVHAEKPGDLLGVIRQSGRKRFQTKVQRMIGDVEALGADEAMYRIVAEAMGYSQNRQAFRKLAEALPFGLMASLPSFQIEQLLLAAAGLTTERSLLSAYIDKPVLSPGELKTFRVRPGNQPVTRLRGLARIINRHRRGLSVAIESVQPSTLWELFIVEADDILVGRSRADDIAINVALPYLAAYRGLDAGILDELRPPEDNRWVKSLKKQLSSAGVKPRPYRAIHQQGMLELTLSFCRYDHCEACPLHQDMVGAQANDGTQDSQVLAH